MIRFRQTKGPDLRELRDDLARRVKNVGTEAGRALAERAQEEVQKRLSGHTGWVKIYRDAIIFRENDEGDHWAVAGYTTQRPDLFEYPAETTLLTIKDPGEGDESTNPTLILSQNQPWPIDVIPALTSAYPGVAEVKAYDAGTVETYRAARLGNLDNVITALKNIVQVDESVGAYPAFQRVYADIAYLARRLELGYAGYPRVPHWGPTVGAMKSQGERWVQNPSVLRLVESALKGEDPVEVTKMSKAEAEEFARIRAASWS